MFFRKLPPELRGYVDHCGGGEVRGWVWDRRRPAKRLRVEIYSAGALLGATTADGYREDLLASRLGDGRYAFSFALPKGDFPPETIAVKVEGSQFWLIDGASRAPSGLANFPARGLPLLRPALSQRMVDDTDVEIAEELQRVWRAATGSRATHAMVDRKTMWGEIVATRHDSLLSCLEGADPRRLATYLVDLQKSSESEGLMQGPLAYRDFVAADAAGRRAAVASFHDMLASLAQYLGIAQAECAEQDYVGETLVLDQAVLVDEIEAALGHPISFPPVFDGLYGLAIGENLLHGRDIQALYAALRAVEASGEARPHILEIGGGFGKVAHYAWLRGVRRYAIIDLPTVCAMQYFYLRRMLPDVRVSFGETGGNRAEEGVDLVFAPRLAEDLELSADIALNCDSFPEMGDAVCRDYFRRLTKWVPLLLSINQEANREVRGPNDRQSVVGALLPEFGYKRRYRFRSWVRPGYVEELWSAPAIEEPFARR